MYCEPNNFLRDFMKRILVAALLLGFVLTSHAQVKPRMRMEDKVRIREAMNIAEAYGENIWKGYNQTPFAILLVVDSVDYLMNHPSPSEDFKVLGEDRILGTRVYYRKSVYDAHLLSTFPAINSVSTIVVGTPEKTGKNSTEWIITLLHEHFHQYVQSSPDYYSAVEKLDLAGGDQTGMWMLNFPFPYDNKSVVAQYEKYTDALSQTVSDIGKPDFKKSFKGYKAERGKLQTILKPADYRYFSFQIWQEGLAQYTEYKFLALANDYSVSEAVKDLFDYVPLNTYREEFYRNLSDGITKCDLAERQRLCLYGAGCAEGLILDELVPAWREKYLKEKFYIERYADDFKPKTVKKKK